MFCAGAYVTSTTGAGEITGLSRDVTVGPVFQVGVADSEPEVRRAVRRILHGGADFIKMLATGAVLTRGGTPGAPEFTEGELRAAVEEAALYGTHVAAHAHGAEGINRAVRAGVRSIEHGSLMDDESIALMAEHGTYLVADIYNGDYIAETGRREGWPADTLRKNDETTRDAAPGVPQGVSGRREDRLRHRQRRVPPRRQRAAASLHGPPRDDARAGDPGRDDRGGRADRLGGSRRVPSRPAGSPTWSRCAATTSATCRRSRPSTPS